MSLIPGATGTPSSFPDGFQVAGNGSPATPAFTFLSPSNNTGMYSPGDDQIAFSSNGVRSLLVGSSGGFTVGTESGSVQVSHTIYGYSSLFTWGNGTLNLSNRNGSNAVTIVMANSTTKFASWSSSNTFPWSVQDSSGNDLGYMSSSGAVTLGPPSGSAVHTMRSGGGTTQINITSSAGAFSTQVKFNAAGGGDGSILVPASGSFTFRNNSDSATFGRISTSDGQWTFGQPTIEVNTFGSTYTGIRGSGSSNLGWALFSETINTLISYDSAGGFLFYATPKANILDSSFTGSVTAGSITGGGSWLIGNAAKIGSSDYNGQLIVGKTNGTAIPVGYVGQTLLSKYTAYTNHSATGTWNADASVALTPGVWVLYGCVTHNLNGATATAFQMAVTSSATAAVALDDENYRESALPTSAFNLSSSVSGLYVNVTANTTYYLNRRAFYSAGTPRHTGMLRAIRIA